MCHRERETDVDAGIDTAVVMYVQLSCLSVYWASLRCSYLGFCCVQVRISQGSRRGFEGCFEAR